MEPKSAFRWPKEVGQRERKTTATEGRFGTEPAERRPRVLHILHELRPSGAEVMLRIAAPLWFGAANPHAILATGRAEGPYAESLRAARFEVFHIPFRKKIGYFCAVYSLIRHGGFDVVHIHTEQANAYYGVVARLAGVHRIVHTIHSTFAFKGLLRVVRMAMRHGLRLLGATPVAVGLSVAENERRTFWNRPVVISNWYDGELFCQPRPADRVSAREKYRVGNNRPIIVTLGNCAKVKNHPLVFYALKELLRRRADWFYLHAGGEDTETSERLLASDLGVAQHCSFLGYTDDPRSVLWAADVFVMSSKLEGCGIAAIEAAACGLPLVLTDVPGLRDLKATVLDAYWVPPEPTALADAIEAAYLRFPSGSAGNASAVRAVFGVERGAKAYYDLYAGLRSPANPYRPEATAVPRS
jgi:glycosyltransferase involved in cell wall biosynthesis